MKIVRKKPRNRMPNSVSERSCGRLPLSRPMNVAVTNDVAILVRAMCADDTLHMQVEIKKKLFILK